jgi:pilus assembly protein CpaD
MRYPFAPRAASGFAAMGRKLLALSLLAAAVAGCKTTDEPGAHFAGLTLVDPSQRHPILVSQEPATMGIRVPRGSSGLSPAQKAQVVGFLERYRGTDAGNSKLVVAVPSGSPNETSVVRAVGDLRAMIASSGFAESNVVVEPYLESRDGGAPIRLSYLRYVAQGPECGLWPANLAREPRNLEYHNFGCAQQHNLAAQIANPADLLGPRTMEPADSERRTVVFDKYRQGRPTGAEKSTDERVQVKGAN